MAKYERDDTKRLLDRVRKLLTLGNDAGASEGERDNALRMAHAILAKHNLDMAQVEERGTEQEREAMNDAEPRINHGGTYGAWPWALQVSMAVAELYFCKYIIVKGKSLHYGHHYFIGRTSNAVTAALVAEFVVKSIYSEACKLSRRNGQGWPFIRSFCTGAMYTVWHRVKELREKPEVEGMPAQPGTSLVLASLYEKEKSANEIAMREFFPSTRKMKDRTKREVLGEAMAQGREYGKRVNLNAQIKGS